MKSIKRGFACREKLGIAAVFALIVFACGNKASGETLPEGWTWRRPLIVKPVLSDAPGENMAWGEFYTNGAQKADGSDIRVTTSDRVLVPFKLMQVSPSSDFIRLAFEIRGAAGEGPYYVWWGNPKAEKPTSAGAGELAIKRGILLEVSRNMGPPGNGPRGAPALDAPQGAVLASFMLPEISLGFNPFGDDRQVMMHYTGQFKIERATTAQMAFTVNDLGALLIDGKEVDRQVRNGLRSQVRSSFSVQLAAGWHSLEIRQVNQNAGNLVMALVWQMPGDKGYTSVPGSIFARAAHAAAGPMEKVGGGASASDISIEPTAEGFLPPSSYGQRYTFEAMYPVSMKPTITWDFGDGQTITGQKRPTHMFLTPGTYPVTLKLEMGSNVLSTTTRLQVKDRLYDKFPRPTEDTAASMRAMLRDYKPEKLPAEQAFRGMLFFESGGAFGDVDFQLNWGMAWLKGHESVLPPDNVVFDETFALAREFESRKQFKEAAECLRLGSLKQIGMETRTNLARLQVMALCDYLDDTDGALQTAQDWIKRVSVSNRLQMQTVQTALAYALIARQDGKAAKAAIDAAVAARGGGPAGSDAFNRRQVRQGSLTRNVENYLQTKDLNTALTLLDQWELEFPEALWDGFTRTLRVKLTAAEGRNLIAARIALEHARANPDGFYAAELLYRAAENFKVAGESEQARTTMDLLKSKYPESPYAREGH
jgi:hypothetical protein